MQTGRYTDKHTDTGRHTDTQAGRRTDRDSEHALSLASRVGPQVLQPRPTKFVKKVLA